MVTIRYVIRGWDPSPTYTLEQLRDCSLKAWCAIKRTSHSWAQGIWIICLWGKEGCLWFQYHPSHWPGTSMHPVKAIHLLVFRSVILESIVTRGYMTANQLKERSAFAVSIFLRLSLNHYNCVGLLMEDLCLPSFFFNFTCFIWRLIRWWELEQLHDIQHAVLSIAFLKLTHSVSKLLSSHNRALNLVTFQLFIFFCYAHPFPPSDNH